MSGAPAALGARTARAHLFLLLLLGFLIYSPSLKGEWVYDDNPAIVANHSLEDLGTWAAKALIGRRTLTDFTFALNRAVGGLNPLGYHILNILIHVVNALLLFRLTEKLLPRLGERREHVRLASTAASLLFLSHPLLSQAVAYTAQRYTSLATLFYLQAILLYVGSRDRRSVLLGVAAFVSAYLAMRAKEIAFTLPLVILFLEVLLYRGKERRLRAALPFLLLLALIPLTLLVGSEGVGRNLPLERLQDFREAPGIGRGEYLYTQYGVILRYLGLLIWPSGLTIDREVVLLRTPFDPRALFPLLLLLAIGVGLWVLRRKAPILLLGYGWFLLTLTVESSIVPIRDLMVEHRVYLPSVGFFLVAGALVARVGRWSRLLLLFLLVPLCVLTYSRSRVWSGPIPLWEDAARKAPDKARPWVNLGLAYRNEGRFAEAEDAYTRALERDGSLVEAVYGLALSLDGEEKKDEALVAFGRARALAPDYGPAYDEAALLLVRLGRRDEAIALLGEGLRRVGEEPARLARLGDQLLSSGRLAEAEEAYALALQRGSGYEPAVIGMARTLLERGHRSRAETFLKGEIERNKRSPHLWNALGLVRLSNGDKAGAAEAFREALRINPGLLEARNNLDRVQN